MMLRPKMALQNVFILLQECDVTGPSVSRSSHQQMMRPAFIATPHALNTNIPNLILKSDHGEMGGFVVGVR
jgi:hypothetical protein